MLDVHVFTETNPIPESMVANYIISNGDLLTYSTNDNIPPPKFQPLKRDIFPQPLAVSSLPHRDITMQSVLGEGDFEHYQGLWRLQSLPNCAPKGKFATRLTYAVEIKPKGFLPVRLIEGRIATDLKENLEAIRKYVEEKCMKREASIQLLNEPEVPNLVSLPSIEVVEINEYEYEATSQTYEQDFGSINVLTSKINLVDEIDSKTSTTESSDISISTSNVVDQNSSSFFRKLLKNNLGIDMFGETSTTEKKETKESSDIQVEKSDVTLLVQENEVLRKKITELEQENAKYKTLLIEVERVLNAFKSS